MIRVAYVDAIAGASGDMLLGALLDAGADLDAVRDGLASLGIEGLDLRLAPAVRHGIAAQRAIVVAPVEEHVRRTWADVRAIIGAAPLPQRAAGRALAIFSALAHAEGAVHGVPAEEVHFHEVGALDAIADICGVALALESLRIDELACSPLPIGRGFVDVAHGRLPLPAPATVELLRDIPVVGVDLDVELVTPTGAAIVAALAVHYGPLPSMRLRAVGYGAGSRDLPERPNLVRIHVGERTADPAREGTAEVQLMEANLDDMPPQLVPDAIERIVALGALDAWVTPTQMKKGRPGLILSVLARPEHEAAVAEVMMRETTTLGVRVGTLRRWEAERSWIDLVVGGQTVRAKVGRRDGEILNVWPEHDDCVTAAAVLGQPVKTVWMAAIAAAEREAGS